MRAYHARPGIRSRARSWEAINPRFLAACFVTALVTAFVIAAAPLSDAAAQDPSTGTDSPTVELTLFWGDGCPHCAAEHEFLDELVERYPDLVIDDYEVWYDSDNLDRFRARAEMAGVDARAVPTTFVDGHVWVGFDDSVAEEIEAVVAALVAERPVEPVDRTTVDVPIVGIVDVGSRSLVVATLLIGFVDGINPCSLWALSILLAVVLHSGSRRRVAIVGATFIFVTSAMYGLYIGGAYSALSYARFLPWIQRGVAIVAGTLGVLQLKELFGVERGPKLGIPDASKPGMFQRMRQLAAPDRPLPSVLGATAVLAMGVSLLETPCTLGLPVLWTDLLSRQDVAPTGAALLFLLYLAAFLVDELLLFGAAVVTMRAAKLQERHGRELKWVSGVVMITLAVTLLARPEAMEEVAGATAVFAIAAVIAVAGIVGDRMVRHT